MSLEEPEVEAEASRGGRRVSRGVASRGGRRQQLDELQGAAVADGTAVDVDAEHAQQERTE
jgi:hypothetical protein